MNSFIPAKGTYSGDFTSSQCIQSQDPSTTSALQSRHITLVNFCIRLNNKISVFQVMGLKILGRVSTHIFLNYFFLEKMQNAFQNA